MSILILIVSQVTTFAATPTENLKAQRPLEFGVLPHLSTSHMEDTFGKIATMFAERTGRRINFNAQLSLEFFQKDLDAGRYDIVFLQPFDYIEANKLNGYEVIATQNAQLYGVLAVRSNSPIHKISDLVGRTISLPPEHTAISYLIKDWLLETGYLQQGKVKLDFEASHISCLQKALFNVLDVCGTARPAINFVQDKLGFEYRVVAETQRIPHTLFAVNPKLDKHLRQQLLEVLLALDKSEEGKEILKTARLKPFRTAQDREYDKVRNMLERIKKEYNNQSLKN